MKWFTKKRVCIIAVVVFAAATVIEALFVHPHGEALWEIVPGADVLLGLAGAALLIFVSKKLLGPLLQRKEDYYGDDDDK